MKRKEAEDIRQQMLLTFELQVCPKKQVLRFMVNEHFFSRRIFRRTYMMFQVLEAGDQRESDGVVTALQARCGRLNIRSSARCQILLWRLFEDFI